jgi:prepilin-type N-terminal cleavage/methylation domain-containing protein
MKKQVRRSGFTLPEILVTVTVVAVLAAVVVPAVTQYVSKGDSPSTLTDLNQIRDAITGYSADTRAYPSTLYELESNPSGVAGYKGPYTGATLSGGTATGVFTSAGLNIKLGPDVLAGGTGALDSGYVTTTLAFIKNSPTCQDLWTLDKTLDSGLGTNADAVTTSVTGMLVWSGGCATTGSTGADPLTSVTIRLRLMAKGATS